MGPPSASRFACLAAILCLALPAWGSASRVVVEPGPTSITDAERTLEPDPETGVEHGVILLTETRLDDSYGTNSELQTHLRAKIFSSEARSLANVVIPLRSSDKITGWWGRTLLPDGRVLELDEKDLVEQQLARVGPWKVRELRGALPGVVPGCVIDYGYTIKSEVARGTRRVDLQRDWPVREFHYHWKPADYLAFDGRLYAAEGREVEIERDHSSVRVSGRRLPPLVREPMMPPVHEVRTAVYFYYVRENGSPKSYWRRHAKRMDELSRTALAGGALDRALAGIGIAPDAPLDRNLRLAYDWIVEDRYATTGGRTGPSSGSSVVAVGSLERPDQLFIQVARRLGAEAHVVLATDRRERSWDEGLKSASQFDVGLVAVRPEGAGDEQAIVVDPSSGLPFGEIPWWVGGTQGMLAHRKGARKIPLPPSEATSNRTTTIVDLRFSADGSRLEAEWSNTARGQAGLEQAVALASRRERLREEKLEGVCGLGPDTDVTRSEHRLLPFMVSELACHIERFLGPLGESTGRISIAWTGPWVRPVPVLPPGARVHPVVFDFPRVDEVRLAAGTPPGFEPVEPPDPTELDSPYGSYRLAIARTADGLTLERTLRLLPLEVPPEEYEALRAFLQEIRRADDTPLEFVRARGG